MRKPQCLFHIINKSYYFLIIIFLFHTFQKKVKWYIAIKLQKTEPQKKYKQKFAMKIT